MIVIITRNIFIKGRPFATGERVEMELGDAAELIRLGRAIYADAVANNTEPVVVETEPDGQRTVRVKRGRRTV